MRISDWSSDVCSSDLFPVVANGYGGAGPDDGVELAGPECSIDLVPLLERNIGVDQADAQSLFLKDFDAALLLGLKLSEDQHWPAFGCVGGKELVLASDLALGQIGRAWGRERVCQYG